jgi:predicted metal-dependent HD superfamily phosphohydrolase
MHPSLLLELTRRYQEPHRRYHSLLHIADMLHRGRELPLDDTQLMAIWFHDAIFDAAASDNEAKSAALAVDRLRAQGWPEDRVQTVAHIVLDTKGHVPSLPAAAPVLDLDLASLALPWEQFKANTAAIRAEYTHVADEPFRQNRRVWAQRMLQKPRLYWTPFGQALEPVARQNLERTLRELG